MSPQEYPTLEQFAANVAAVVGKIEVVQQELYDRVFYPTAGINILTFFSTPIGAGVSTESGVAAATPKSQADTNMTQNGQLPAPQAFWIDNIQVDVDAGSSAAANTFVTLNPTIAVAAAAITDATGIQDKSLILEAGWLQLFIGQKPYYTHGPLKYFPPRAQTRLDMSRGNSDTTTHNDVTSSRMWIDGDGRTLDPGLGLPTGMNFGVTINFAALQATVANNARIKTMLGGWLFRAAQ